MIDASKIGCQHNPRCSGEVTRWTIASTKLIPRNDEAKTIARTWSCESAENLQHKKVLLIQNISRILQTQFHIVASSSQIQPIRKGHRGARTVANRWRNRKCRREETDTQKRVPNDFPSAGYTSRMSLRVTTANSTTIISITANVKWAKTRKIESALV